MTVFGRGEVMAAGKALAAIQLLFENPNEDRRREKAM